MLTSDENRSWEGDVPIDDLALAGLPAPSVARCAKIATRYAEGAEPLCLLAPETFAAVRARIRAMLGETDR